ncbi:MAG: carbamoyl-phosphate synthase large subunit, partial [Nitrospinota bacterium]
AMAIGRTFKESLQKAVRSLETGSFGFEEIDMPENELLAKLEKTYPERLWLVAQGYRMGVSTERLHALTGIDPWFLDNIKEIVETEEEIKSLAAATGSINRENLLRFKRMGFSDRRIAQLTDQTEADVRRKRHELGVRPVFKRVDTCAAEFEALTPYMYSTYEEECEAEPSERKKIVILGGGPNRIGQGIEFDYCCVHGVFALKEAGYETIMINCNPETVSTDFDTSDRLYFEPLTLEDVLEIVHKEKPEGVIVQFGGQTPLKLALALESEGVPIIGTTPDAIDRAEDRERFKGILHKLGLKQPVNDTARTVQEAVGICKKIGFPVVVRPSYVLGGRAMEIVYDNDSLLHYMAHAVRVSDEHPVLIDRFLENSVEIDVDAISDGGATVIGGVMEHIEEAGIHSGDSACTLPPRFLSKKMVDEICAQTKMLAAELGVKGLINIQFAVKGTEIYLIEVNPRASRTVPFVSKAIGAPLAKYAARVIAGETLEQLGFTKELIPKHVSVKEAVLPFIKFTNVDPILGPEMKSTGEVMGIDRSFGSAFARATQGTGSSLPVSGTVFISVTASDRAKAVKVGSELAALGFKLLATRGTAGALEEAGVEAKTVNKVMDGSPHIVDVMQKGEVNLVINTTFGKQAHIDSYSIRRTALVLGIPYTTTMAGAQAVLEGIKSIMEGEFDVSSLQERHA